MALIKCKECGKEISDSAKRCPHCGFVYKKEKAKKEKSKAFKIIVPIISVISVFIVGIVSFILFTESIEHKQEEKLLDKIVGTWEYRKTSKTNGGISYDIITFSENKTFKKTSGFIYQGNDDFKYSYKGKIDVYANEDNDIFLYMEEDTDFHEHFQYNNDYDELYERDDTDGSLKQYYRTD